MGPKAATPTGDGPAERLLKAADRLFYEQGYNATGINELLAESGVAKASFYHHFTSKDGLILAYLEQRGAEWFQGLLDRVDRHKKPARKLLAVFDYLEDWLVETEFRGCAYVNSIPEFPDPESDVRVVVREAKQHMRDYLTGLCTDAGCPDAGDQVFLLFEGAMTQAAALTDAWPVKAARKTVTRLTS